MRLNDVLIGEQFVFEDDDPVRRPTYIMYSLDRFTNPANGITWDKTHFNKYRVKIVRYDGEDICP